MHVSANCLLHYMMFLFPHSLKPPVPHPERLKIMITDFGLSKMEQSSRPSPGTPGWPGESWGRAGGRQVDQLAILHMDIT